MNLILYNREASLEIYQTAIYSSLRELGYKIAKSTTIKVDSNDLYLILGGQFIVEVPKRYIIIQTLPTSHLTMANNLEAYWMDNNYIDLLRHADCIWEMSKESIKIWRDYYGFKPVFYLPFGYSSMMTERVTQLFRGVATDILPKTRPNDIPDQMNALVVIGEDRADKWMRSLPERDSRYFNLTLRSAKQPFQLITSLKVVDCTVIIIADYENTFPDIGLCYALRYNGIHCLVEQPRDKDIQQQLKSIGCQLIPWIRLSKHFKTSVEKILATDNTRHELPKRIGLSSEFSRNPDLLKILNDDDIDREILNEYEVIDNIAKNGEEKGEEKGEEEEEEKGGGEDAPGDRKNYNYNDEEPDKSSKKKKKKRIKNNNKDKSSLYIREAIRDVNYDLLDDGGISLKIGDIDDDELPIVTICTPTANRRMLFSLAIRNFMSFIYPEDKLRWVILDNGDKPIEEIIPRDYRIRYQYIDSDKNKLSVAQMRNKLVELATSEIILFMDDDDYYPPENILARTKALLKYSVDGVDCVGCRDVASYDLKHGLCAICSNGEEYLTESSLAFRRTFWQERPFRETDKTSEYRYFLEYRQDRMRSIPFQFVTVALTHGTNTTGGVRDLDFYRKWKPSEDWEDTKKSILNVLDEDTQDFLNMLKKAVIH